MVSIGSVESERTLDAAGPDPRDPRKLSSPQAQDLRVRILRELGVDSYGE